MKALPPAHGGRGLTDRPAPRFSTCSSGPARFRPTIWPPGWASPPWPCASIWPRSKTEGLATPAPAGAARKGRGRPLTLWQASEAANDHFPDSHSLLAVDLLGQMKKAFGEDGPRSPARLAHQRPGSRLWRRTARAKTLKGRLEALRRIRESEGYMPELRRDPQGGASSSSRITARSARPPASARACAARSWPCSAVLLGPGVRVERTDHILAGATRCAYRVTETS